MSVVEELLKEFREKDYDKGVDPTGLYVVDPVGWGNLISDKENDIDEPINEELIERYNGQALSEGLAYTSRNEGMFVIYPANPYAFQSKEDVDNYFVERAKIRQKLAENYSGDELIEKYDYFYEKLHEIYDEKRKELLAIYGRNHSYRDEESLAEIGELEFQKENK